LSASDRRSAVIGMKVRPGMTRADVESSLGKPDQISTRNGQTQYRYTKDKARPRMVSFDEHNCVLGKK
jgi:outer membrane protein assembly factor BamE (lipoprotein component of BamABCDE complex)